VIYPALAWLRETCPLGVARVAGFDDLWIVTRHADVMAVERDPKLFSSGDLNPILNDRAGDAFLREMNAGSIRSLHSLTFMDPPEHGRNRAIAANAFLPGQIAELTDQIRAIARQAVDNFLCFDGQCDFVKDFALYYPLRVVMTQLGVPPEDEPRMLKLTQEFFGVHDPEEQRVEIVGDPVAAAKQWSATIQDFYDYFNALRADRRARPRPDLLTLVGNAKLDGDYVSDDVANGFYVALAVAGHDTTSSTTAGGMKALLDFPDQFALLRSDPALIPGFVDEAIRWTSPVKHFMRAATADTEVGGQAIRAGDRLFLSYPSANRDAAIFDHPDRFDITRSPNRHLAFGFGPHICLGQHLAKLEMRILFEELLPHLAAIEAAGPARSGQTNFVGGLKSLPMRFSKA
jgi:cytochrome P450